MTTTLVTGPVRSGKSRHAESLLSSHGEVVYVACGRPPDEADPEWEARVREHRSRRPSGWETVETLDVVAVLSGTNLPMLVDCLGTWLTGIVDRVGWDDLDRARGQVRQEGERLVQALSRHRGSVVLVTNEVGWSLVPVNPTGRFFADELGRLNAAVSAVARRVHLVVAGRVVDLTDAPVVPSQPPPRGLHA